MDPSPSRLGLSLLVCVIGFAGTLSAQQTIFSVPTTDVLERGKIYLELDALFKTNDQSVLNEFSTFVPRVVVGVGANVEVSLNVTGNIQPGADATALALSAKWRFYNNAETSTALAAGTVIYLPVRHRSYRIGAFSYLAASHTLNKTRVTAGVYIASNNVFVPNAVRGGGQFGVEQTINSRLNINADWITGKHAAGYASAGAAYKLTKKLTAVAAYSFGNHNLSKGNHFFYSSIGYNIN